jgi:hypothetical protein
MTLRKSRPRNSLTDPQLSTFNDVRPARVSVSNPFVLSRPEARSAEGVSKDLGGSVPRLGSSPSTRFSLFELQGGSGRTELSSRRSKDRFASRAPGQVDTTW